MRFSLKTLLVVMAVVSLLIAAIVAFPRPVTTSVLIVLLQIIPIALLCGVLWGRGYERVFCIGALVPAALTLLALGPAWIYVLFDKWEFRIEDAVVSDVVTEFINLMTKYHGPHRIIAVLSWTCSLLMGLIAVALRRWVFRGGA